MEVDLVFYSNRYLFVEVKSLSRTENLCFRLSSKQRQRLNWARNFFFNTQNEMPLLKVVFVTPMGKLIVLDIEDFD